MPDRLLAGAPLPAAVRRAAVPALAVLLAVGCALGAGVELSSEVARLGYTPADLEAVRRRLEARWPGATRRGLVALRAPGAARLADLRSLLRAGASPAAAAGAELDGVRWGALEVVFEDRGAEARLQARLDASALAGAAWVLSPRLEIGRSLGAIVDGLRQSALLLLCFAVVLLLLVTRSPRVALAALLPAAFGLACTAALHRLAGAPLSVVALLGLVQVVGVTANHGVFMALAEPGQTLQPARAVLTSGLALLGGFAAMACARVGAVQDIGRAAGPALAISLLVALYVVPWLVSSGRSVT